MGANSPSSQTRSVLSPRRIDGGAWRIVDRWRDKVTSQDLPHEWTGSRKFRKSWGALSEQTQSKQQRSRVGSACIGKPMRDTASLVEEDSKFEIDLRAESDILDLKARCGKSERKDQCEVLWLIRRKRPKLVIGYGRCILSCAVLYHEQIRRGAWFLHDLSGDASQLSLLCMTRMECRHDVFHALGDVRDRRDGARVSVLTNRPRIAGWKGPNVERIWIPRSAKVFGDRLAT